MFATRGLSLSKVEQKLARPQPRMKKDPRVRGSVRFRQSICLLPLSPVYVDDVDGGNYDDDVDDGVVAVLKAN